jgi:glycosyltransferase involved in cell wall biosynthesis
MHVLFVVHNFPSPVNPHVQPFIAEQVRLLCERKEQIKRVTVLSPTTFVPRFLGKSSRFSNQILSPHTYQMADGRSSVYYPRYLKAPGMYFLPWTLVQWCRIINDHIKHLAKTDPVSIIHANFGTVAAWASISVAKRYRIPSAVTYQGSDVHTILAEHRKGWWLCRDAFKLADLNLMVSRSLESILRLYAEPSGRCEVFIRGVDQAKFYPASRLDENQNVLFVGRVEEAKGAFDLLSAWAKVQRTCPAALLSVAGPDRTKGRFLDEAQALGIDHSIRFYGPVPLSQIPGLMRQSRIFCLPSHKEGTPNCVMEALASGLPVVATRVGGMPDVVVHGKTGLLVDKGDVDGLTSALTTLLNHREQCMSLGKAAHAYAREHLDARKSITRLIQIYDELINSYRERQVA